jgi:2-polyprenyl-3-methyl-5-hydroxy-6-metoxy-1,4-benzoquinol methylase
MITNPMEMRAMLHELSVSAWALAAIGALFESSLVEQLREPRTLDDLAGACPQMTKTRIERLLAVASSVGIVVADGGRYRFADGAMPFSQPPMRNALIGQLRTDILQPVDFVKASRASMPRVGWVHTDKEILQAQGDASSVLPMLLKMQIIPQLGDLGARMEDKATRFLDVGVGVGALAVAMCRMWPNLSAVGLDVADAPLELARENVARAGLNERIELRKTGVEELREEAAFDLAWLPGFFIPQALMAKAMARIHAALKPGGWVIVATLGGGTDRQKAVAGLITDVWGGPQMPAAEGTSLLTAAGFSTVRVLPGPEWAPATVVAQR